MPAKDRYHDIVKQALIREGWIITHDPYRLFIGKRKAYIDLGAERVIGAEKDGERIAVEIKVFSVNRRWTIWRRLLDNLGFIVSA